MVVGLDLYPKPVEGEAEFGLILLKRGPRGYPYCGVSAGQKYDHGYDDYRFSSHDTRS